MTKFIFINCTILEELKMTKAAETYKINIKQTESVSHHVRTNDIFSVMQVTIIKKSLLFGYDIQICRLS